MAVQRRVNWISQQRVDVPDMRAVESAASNDFDQLIQAFVTGTSQGYFLRGFNILMAGAIGGAASGLQLNVDPGAVLHIASSVSGTIYMVPTGTLPQQLNSATNTIVDGAFAPSAINYVSIEYERFIDNTTSAQVYLWNPTTNNETTKNAPRAQILRYRIKITTATPASNYLPVAVVTTDSGNNVTNIEDARWDLFRLGAGGPSPDPFFNYTWPEGRSENPSSSNSNSVDPFSGGDKAIGTLKDWMNAVMSSIKEIKGTTYWYSQSSSGSLDTLREDLGNTVITGRGSIAHGVLPSDKTTPTQAGQINWDQPINIRVIGSALTYSLSANPSSTDITLSDDQAAYISLVRGITVAPNLIFTTSLSQVTSVGAISWTGPLAAGDYLKLAADTDAGYYQIQSVDSLTQVTLATPFTETGTGVGGAKGQYAFGTYNAVTTPSGPRDIFVTTRELVPEGQDIFWLFLRTDNGGAQSRVYIRFLGSELSDGEDRDISDSTSAELLKYIGASSAASFAPQYVSALTPGAVPEIQTLTLPAGNVIPQSSYFFINSSNNARMYYVWFNIGGAGTDPNPGATNGSVEVDILLADTAAQVATKLATALNTTFFGDFKAVASTNTVQVTNSSAGVCQPAVDGNIGAPFAVVVNQTGTGTGNNYIKDGDSLTLAIKELDQAIATIAGVIDEPSYDEGISIVASGATPPTSITGPITSGSTIALPNNTRLADSVQRYTVGKGILEVYLNGQYLRNGADWAEQGAAGSLSNTFQILQDLEIGDLLDVRISSIGGSGGGGGGGEGPPGPPGATGPAGHDAAGGPVAISTKTGSYSVINGDNVLLANTVGGVITFTLPTSASATGRIFYFKKIDSTANAMIIQANGSELIDGTNTQSTAVQYESFTLVTDGSGNWYIL